MQLVAIDILVLRLTNDGVAVGFATAARFGPMLVLGPWAGLLSDRVDRHKLVIGTSAAGAAVATVFTAVVASGTSSLPSIYALATLSGVVTALESPARRARVVDLVVDDDATNAIGLNNATMTGAKISGPAIAGALIGTVGITWCFAINALSFLPQVVLLVRMDRRLVRPVQRAVRAPGQLRDGFRVMWSTVELRRPMLMVAAIGTMTFNYSVIFPLFATRDLGYGASAYTVLLSVMSVGSVIGALMIARRVYVGVRFLARASLVLAVAGFGLAAAPNLWVAVVLVIPTGAATMMVNSGAFSMVQLVAAPQMRGRVLAMLSVVFVGTTPVGGPIVGALCEHLGARWALAIGAATALATGIGGLWSLREGART